MPLFAPFPNGTRLWIIVERAPRSRVTFAAARVLEAGAHCGRRSREGADVGPYRVGSSNQWSSFAEAAEASNAICRAASGAVEAIGDSPCPEYVGAALLHCCTAALLGCCRTADAGPSYALRRLDSLEGSSSQPRRGRRMSRQQFHPWTQGEWHGRSIGLQYKRTT